MDDPKHDPGVLKMLAYQGGEEGAFEDLVVEYSGTVFALLTNKRPATANNNDILVYLVWVVRNHLTQGKYCKSKHHMHLSNKDNELPLEPIQQAMYIHSVHTHKKGANRISYSTSHRLYG